MSERRSVTREGQRPLSNAEAAVFDEWFGPASDGLSVAVRRAIRDGLADALPATPAASGDVEAAWEALAFALDDYADERLADQQLAIRREVATQLLVEHRPRIEAAIRAEAFTLGAQAQHDAEAALRAESAGTRLPPAMLHDMRAIGWSADTIGRLRLLPARLAEDAE